MCGGGETLAAILGQVRGQRGGTCSTFKPVLGVKLGLPGL